MRYYGDARIGAAGMLLCTVFHGFVRAARGPFLTGAYRLSMGNVCW